MNPGVQLRPALHVVAGLIEDAQGRILLAQRPPGDPYAGHWEFPGGKVDPGEPPDAALRRELAEELGVQIGHVSPVRAIRWPQGDRDLLLDLWRIHELSGQPYGREGQAIEWFERDRIRGLAMPPADLPLLDGLVLPDRYWITPEADEAELTRRLDQAISAGVQLVQLRAKSWSTDRRLRWCRSVLSRIESMDAQLLINDDIEAAERLPGVGLHLSAAHLARLDARPIERPRWVSASCHNLPEIRAAERLRCDFACLSPVLPTPSHPGAPVLGWEGFRALAAQTWLPLFALGGMSATQRKTARDCGALGVAGIRMMIGE